MINPPSGFHNRLKGGLFPLFRTTARTQVQFGLAAEIGNNHSGTESAVRGARLEAMRWVYRSVNVVAPAYINITDSFESNDTPGVKFGLATAGAEWVARMERSDNSVPGRYWTTEISVNVDLDEDVAWLAVRNTCTDASGVTEVVPMSTPRFVRFFAKRIGLLDAGVAIREEAWLVENERDLDVLAELTVRDDRFLPIILITEPYALDAIDVLAKRAVGVAHVVTMPDRFTRPWSELVGKEMGAFFGAVRTYYPGLDLAADSPFDHPLALRKRVLGFSSLDGGSGPNAFSEYLLRKCYASGAGLIVRDERFPRFSALRAATAIGKRQSSGPSAEDQALLALANDEINQAKQMEQLALEDNLRLERELKQMQAEMHGMTVRLEHLITTLKDRGRKEDVPIPNDLEELRDWADKYLAGRVHLMPRAYRGAKDSQYEQPQLIYQALLWLATDYYDGKLAEVEDDPLRINMRRKLDEMGMEYAASVQQEFADNDFYYIDYGGASRFMNMAIKKGRDREPRYCMRIYTFWDEASQQTIVGSLPQHGPIRE